MQINNNQPQPDAKTILVVDNDVSVLSVVKWVLVQTRTVFASMPGA
jgi:hypothetical protein